ncbi:hypothetical protein HNR65_002145 [Desulfosalsimonas propionicica]|uniref:Uncharacterized protein n=1 Tax=Desulfosalsimonas propionicica TaxID=332175 RepID=A0A7W0CA05_9BACT|nr:hypothetical protein [Desulfosalsimonas propionicica]
MIGPVNIFAFIKKYLDHPDHASNDAGFHLDHRP